MSAAADVDQELLGFVGRTLLEQISVVLWLWRVKKGELQLELVAVAVGDTLNISTSLTYLWIEMCTTMDSLGPTCALSGFTI